MKTYEDGLKSVSMFISSDLADEVTLQKPGPPITELNTFLAQEPEGLMEDPMEGRGIACSAVASCHCGKSAEQKLLVSYKMAVASLLLLYPLSLPGIPPVTS